MSENDELDAAVTAIRSHLQTGAGVIRSWSLSRLLAGYDRRGEEIERLESALRPPVDAEYLSDVERNAVALATENERLRNVVQEVGKLASEWERFGLKGAAQRLRHILGEVTA